jgi:uncharacterized protein YegJ (DUF2314 family)
MAQMSRIYLLFFLMFAFTLRSQAQSDSKTYFQKEYRIFNVDTSIKIAVPFKNYFYCLKSNGGILVINKSNDQINPAYTDNSIKIHFLNLYLKNDSLIGIAKTGSYFLNDQNDWIRQKNSFIIPPIFEDDKFIVTSSCSGEWGGSIYFKDKKNNKIYTSIATCVVSVKKLKNSYNVTATLAHLSGFSNVFDVDDPKSLKPYKKDTFKGKKVIYVGDNESKSTKGTKQLVDSVGVETPVSFIYKDQLFYLLSKRNETFITNIQNNRFIILDKLSDVSIWSYNPQNRSYGNETIYSFENYQTSGFITINSNKIKFYSFNWKHN